MFSGWRARYSQWLVSGGYLVLLLLGAQLESRNGWRLVAAAIAVLAFFAWQAALARLRAVADTPTSSIASAAQGYVELQGSGAPVQGTPLLAPLTQLPCLWYRFKVERRQGKDWVTESSGQSSASFLIMDGSGECAVDPEGAEVLPSRTDSWRRDDYRYSQSLILAGDPLYVIGAFRTLSGDGLALDLRQDLSQLLADWKQDWPALLQRFDHNGNQRIDPEEWEEARRQALRQVEQAHRELRALPDSHTLGQPADGRLFLISTLAPDRIARRFRLWSYGHVAVFLTALGGLGSAW